MKSLLFVATIVASNICFASVHYYNQVSLSNTVSQVKLVDAQYTLIPTKTVVQPIPGCRPGGEAGNTCEETVVLESQGVIRAYISYVDLNGTGEHNEPSFTSVVFNLKDFSTADVELLKSVYPQWKHPFSNEGRDFAKNKLSLSTETLKKTIQVADMDKSKFCSVNNESGEKRDPNCQDQIVYKDSWTLLTLVTVTHK